MCCKKCGGSLVVKNGIVRGKQRYLCKSCKYNFVEGDGRKGKYEVQKVFAVFLYTMNKASFNFLAKKVFNVSPTAVMNWIKEASKKVELPEISGDIKEMEFDEM
jgi:transposase-like protein